MSLLSPAIELFGTYDRGTPNAERIVLRVSAPIELSTYFLFLGYRAPLNADRVLPIPDQFLWLGETFIQMPSWIFVYTGAGKTGVSQEVNTKEPVHCLYWNKPSVVLASQDIVPALARIDAVSIGNKPNKTLVDLNKAKGDEIDFAKLLAGEHP